jgi:nucleotide-binding universal stress UspA family protein
MFQHLLVPLDGSEHSLEALAQARDLARSFGARVTLFGVVTRAETPGSPAETAIDEQSRSQVEAYLASKLEALSRADIADAEVAVGFGNAAAQVVEFARANEVDLIVMCRQGVGGPDEVALGSVALKVLMTAPCAVLMIRDSHPLEA